MSALRALPALLLLAAAAAPARAAAPRLVVLVTVDQMRADFLERFGPLFGEKGFKRLLAKGTSFDAARHPYAATETCPGHAILGSGLYPSESGIVANTWYDRAAAKPVYCTDSPSGPSAGQALGRSLAQRLKERYPEALAVGVSLKDRSAIYPLGAGADAAYWLGDAGFQASPPQAGRAEALAFNAKLPAYVEKHKTWTYGLSVPESEACPFDAPEAHSDPRGIGARFPHTVKDAKAMVPTPGGNDVVADLALHLAEVYGLGSDETPDLLAVSFSAIDYVGHNFGPDSCEMADAMARLDGDLARLLAGLEARVKGPLVVVLSADHGAAPLPESSKKKGLDAGRVLLYAPKEGTLADLPEPLRRLELAASERFGLAFTSATPISEGLLAFSAAPWVWLSPSRLAALGVPAAEVRAWAAARFAEVEGIEAVYTYEQMKAGKGVPVEVRRNFHPERAGDLFLRFKPYWIASPGATGTDHGSLQDYDARVPLVWMGPGAPAGLRVAETVTTAQVAPSLARLLELSLSGFSDPRTLPRVVRPARKR